MSENQAHQDNIEQECLNFVRSNIKKEDCFGMSRQQYIELQRWLKDAKPNQDSNEFPDFLFEDGFIEHFAVTSSSEGKKGAKQKQQSSIFKSKSKDAFFSKLDSSEENTLVNHSASRNFEEHTHFNIVNSIKKNWENHIKSYENSTSEYKHGIFLLEYIDINLETAICWDNEPAEIFESYRISADKILLEWIYEFKEKIDYFILINPLIRSIEVIRIDQILNITKDIPNVVKYAYVSGFEVNRYAGIQSKNKMFNS